MKIIAANIDTRVHLTTEITAKELEASDLLIHGSPLHPSDLVGGVVMPALPETTDVNQVGKRITVPHDNVAVITTSRANTWFPLVRSFFHDLNDPNDEGQWPFTLMKTGEVFGGDISPFMVARNSLRHLVKNGKVGYLYGLAEQPTQCSFTGQSGMHEVRLKEPARWIIAAEASLLELPLDLMVLDGSPEALRKIKHTPFEYRREVLQSADYTCLRFRDVRDDSRYASL